jgi:hypothetical protein
MMLFNIESTHRDFPQTFKVVAALAAGESFRGPVREGERILLGLEKI